MTFQLNFSLKNLNTFGINVKARRYADFASVTQLLALLQDPETDKTKLLVLGGGSNILFTRDFEGTVLQNKISGIGIIEEQEAFALVQAGGGVVWHDLVLFALNKNLGGIENLSLIPGTVGAAPLQNIGAYGVELKDVFYSLEAVDIQTAEIKTFTAEDCQFGYRESVFKKNLRGRFIVTRVVLKLSKNPVLNTSYGAIRDTLEAMQVDQPNIKAVSEAVCSIRRSKLPDPAVIGNAGSFFKNPEISLEDFAGLKSRFPEIPSYPAPHNLVKVPAGWLIERCGWKGRNLGEYGVHKDQALVLVNYGGAAGSQIRDLAHDIIRSVRETFSITLTPEVNIL